MMHGSLGNSMANLKTFFFSKFSKVFQKFNTFHILDDIKNVEKKIPKIVHSFPERTMHIHVIVVFITGST